MTISIDLPEDVELVLSREAARLGMTLPEYALRVLATGTSNKERPSAGKELVDYWTQEGLVGTRPDIADNQQHARTLREAAERRVSYCTPNL